MKKIESILILLLLYVAVFAHEGKASFYHDKFHGRLTASGTVFNQNELTCAHKTLPFGTLLKVTNLSNGKEVKVVVTDRGPFIEGRHVDLSRKAAEQINMIPQGVQAISFDIIGNVLYKTNYNHIPNNAHLYVMKPEKDSVDISHLYEINYKIFCWKKVESRANKPETLNLNV